MISTEALQEQIEAFRKVIAEAQETLAALEAEAIYRNVRVGEVSDIINQVAEEFGVSRDCIVGKSQRQAYFVPRAIAMWRIRQTNRYSLPQIGRFFSGRNHASVLHALRRAEEIIAATPNRPAQNPVTNSSCPVTNA